MIRGSNFNVLIVFIPRRKKWITCNYTRPSSKRPNARLNYMDTTFVLHLKFLPGDCIIGIAPKFSLLPFYKFFTVCQMTAYFSKMFEAPPKLKEWNLVNHNLKSFNNFLVKKSKLIFCSIFQTQGCCSISLSEIQN